MGNIPLLTVAAVATSKIFIVVYRRARISYRDNNKELIVAIVAIGAGHESKTWPPKNPL
jgi:hypothetical protein